MTNKTLIKLVTITCAIVLAMFAFIPCGVADEDRGEFYPKLSVVTCCARVGELWLVDCIDKDGNIYSFWEDEEAWNVGDLANLLMWNMHTVEEEDELVEVYYEGHITPEAVSQWIEIEK